MGIIVRNLSSQALSKISLTYRNSNVAYWRDNKLYNSKYEVIHEFPVSYFIFARHSQFIFIFDNSSGWYIKYNLFTKNSENIWQTNERISNVQTVNAGIQVLSLRYDSGNDFICYGRNDRLVGVISVKAKTRLYTTSNYNTSTGTYRRIFYIRVVDNIIYCCGDHSITAANIHTQQILWRWYNNNVFNSYIHPNNSDWLIINYGFHASTAPIGIRCLNRFTGATIWANNNSFNQTNGRPVGIMGLNNDYIYTHQHVSNVLRVINVDTGVFIKSSNVVASSIYYESTPSYDLDGNFIVNNGNVIDKETLGIKYNIENFSSYNGVYDSKVLNKGYHN